jgi:glyoxylase-like metal-dependent hydrolase (beta-lactamase superfamily II)
MIMTNSTFAQEQSENIFTHKVGKFEVILLSEGQGQGNSDLLIGVTPQMREECILSGTFPIASNVFLVKTPERNILVDAGYATKLFSNLNSLRINPDQIDAVLITHMHGDHIGGLLQNDKVTFPKAKIYISQLEYDFWTDDKSMQQAPEERRGGFMNARKMIAAYKDNINLFQPNTLGKDLYELLPGISGIAAYGHTPGHTMYLVESNNDQMLIWGDLTHAMAIQMPYPSVAVTYDSDPKQAVITRENVLDYVSRNNIPVAGMHIPFPAMGIISTISSGGYIFYPYLNNE